MKAAAAIEHEIDPIRDADYYKQHQDAFLAKYSGRMVAIRGEEVVADAETYFELHRKLCERYGGPAYAYVQKVTPASFEDWGDEPAYLIQ